MTIMSNRHAVSRANSLVPHYVPNQTVDATLKIGVSVKECINCLEGYVKNGSTDVSRNRRTIIKTVTCHNVISNISSTYVLLCLEPTLKFEQSSLLFSILAF